MSDIKTITQGQLVKTTGWFYLLIIVSSLLSLIFWGGKYTVMGDNAASISKMVEFSTLVRVNAVYEVFMFSAVIVLAVLLYQLTKSLNPSIAASALLFRLAEAMLGYMGIILSLGVLVLTAQHSGVETTNSLAVLLLDLKDIVYKILMFCISFGTILYFYLFHKAGYVPRFLSIWAITGFGLMVVSGILQLLALPGGMISNAIAAGLAISFELTIGVWFVVKGIKTT